MNKKIWMLLLTAIFLLPTACQPAAPPHQFAGAELVEPSPAPDFTLQSAAGPVSLSDFEGQYVFIYFGYTYCPDVCPATLAHLARARDMLGEDADKMQVLMVTVDPERDTAEHLAEYVSVFDDSFVGLTGSAAEIDATGKPYGLFYQRHEGTAASGYLVDHTSRAFLIGPDGNALVAYPFDATGEQIAADMQYLLAQES